MCSYVLYIQLVIASGGTLAAETLEDGRFQLKALIKLVLIFEIKAHFALNFEISLICQDILAFN